MLERRIYYTFTFSSPGNLSKIRDLIETVRPAGCGVILVPADIINTIDGIEIHSFEQGTKYNYDITRYSVGQQDRVGFSEVENKQRVKNPEEESNI